MTCTSHAKAGNREPPAPATGNPDGQIGQRPDAVPMQHQDDARRQPGVDRIADPRLRDGQRRQDVQRPGRGFAVARAFAGRALKKLRQIRAMTAEGKTNELPANAADHAAR